MKKILCLLSFLILIFATSCSKNVSLEDVETVQTREEMASLKDIKIEDSTKIPIIENLEQYVQFKDYVISQRQTDYETTYEKTTILGKKGTYRTEVKTHPFYPAFVSGRLLNSIKELVDYDEYHIEVFKYGVSGSIGGSSSVSGSWLGISGNGSINGTIKSGYHLIAENEKYTFPDAPVKKFEYNNDVLDIINSKSTNDRWMSRCLPFVFVRKWLSPNIKETVTILTPEEVNTVFASQLSSNLIRIKEDSCVWYTEDFEISYRIWKVSYRFDVANASYEGDKITHIAPSYDENDCYQLFAFSSLQPNHLCYIENISDSIYVRFSTNIARNYKFEQIKNYNAVSLNDYLTV